MAKKFASRTAQWPLVQEFVFNYNDWAVDSVSGVKKTFCAAVSNSQDPVTGETISGLTAGTDLVFDAIPMPLGAVISSVSLIVDTAFNGTGTDTVAIATTNSSPVTILAATSLETAAQTDVTITKAIAMACNGGDNIRLTFANGGADASAGKARVRVTYTIEGKANENSIT